MGLLGAYESHNLQAVTEEITIILNREGSRLIPSESNATQLISRSPKTGNPRMMRMMTFITQRGGREEGPRIDGCLPRSSFTRRSRSGWLFDELHRRHAMFPGQNRRKRNP